MKEIHVPSNLKKSLELPFLTAKIKMDAGKYEEGELIAFDYSSEKGSKCTDAQNLYGVCTDTVTVEAEGYITVYISGVFNKAAIKKESGVEWKDIEKNARPLNMLFR